MKNFNKHIYNLCHNYQYKLHALTRAYSLSYNYNLTPPISQVLISQYLVFCSLTSPKCCKSPRRCAPVKYKKRSKAGFPIVT